MAASAHNTGALRDDDELDPQKQAQVDAAAAVFAQLLKGFKNIALYRHNTARYGEFLERAYQAMCGYLDGYQALTVKVEAEAFTLYKQPLLPPGSDERLAYRFYQDGIRQLVFRAGLTPEEFQKFALIAMTNFDEPAHRGESVLSLLWAAGLEHVEHLVVEGFAIADLSEEEVQVEVDKIVAYLYQRLRSTSDDFLRFARISAEDLNLKMEAVDQARGVVIQGQPVTEKLAQIIQSDLHGDEGPRLLPKLVSVIFSLLEEEPDPVSFQDVLTQLLDTMLLQEDFGTVNQILVKLRALERKDGHAESAEQLRSFFLGKMGEPERLSRLIEALRAGPVKQAQELQRYLSALEPEAVITLLEGLDTVELPQNRQLLCDAMAVLGAQTPEPFVARLGSDRSALVRDMLYVLDKLDVPEKAKLFEGALRNPNLAVRLEALAVIGKGRTEANRSLLLAALQDRYPQMRIAAARALVHFDPERGFQDLQRTIKSPDFDKRDEDEQRAFYASLGASQQPGALALFQGLLQQKGGFLKKKKVAEDKLLAIAGLSEHPSIAAYKLLQGESENKGNEPEVLLAARKAMFQIKKQLFGDQGPQKEG
ncbi:MAG: HEAT repeat domain-containing protein [Myxococcales bacterium]